MIDRDHLLKRIACVAKLAKSDHQKALMGRVIYVIENEPEIDIMMLTGCTRLNIERNENGNSGKANERRDEIN